MGIALRQPLPLSLSVTLRVNVYFQLLLYLEFETNTPIAGWALDRSKGLASRLASSRGNGATSLGIFCSSSEICPYPFLTGGGEESSDVMSVPPSKIQLLRVSRAAKPSCRKEDVAGQDVKSPPSLSAARTLPAEHTRTLSRAEALTLRIIRCPSFYSVACVEPGVSKPALSLAWRGSCSSNGTGKEAWLWKEHPVAPRTAQGKAAASAALCAGSA